MRDNSTKVAKEFRVTIAELRKKYTNSEIEQGLVLALGASGLQTWLDDHPEIRENLGTARKAVFELIDFAKQLKTHISTEQTKTKP